MKIIDWSDVLRSRDRKPKLFFLKDDDLFRFNGNPISKVCAIRKDSYRKEGKWSGSTYQIVIADDVIPIEICCPFEGWGLTWSSIVEGVKTLGDDSLSDYEKREIIMAAVGKGDLQLVNKSFFGYDDLTHLGEAIASAEENDYFEREL